MKANRSRKPPGRVIVSNAKKLLAYAEEHAKTVKFRSELFNSIFAPGAKASEFFATEAERREFWRTEERRKIFDLINGLPSGPILDEVHEIDLRNKRVTIRRGNEPPRVMPITK